MIRTPDLIDALVADVRPVRRLRPPLARTAAWLVLPVLVFALLALAHGARPDLGARMIEPAFVVSVSASLATGVLSTIAAFMLNLPDRTRAWGFLPLPSLALWIGSVGQQCLTQWVAIGPDGMQLGESARCFATVLLTGLPLSLAMFVMLRRGALLRAGATAMTAALAVAAMSAAAISIFHRIDASAMVLLWNFGTATLFVLMGGWVGRHFGRSP
jgi:hypothetical protein